MAKDVSVKMELPLEDGEELLPEMEKTAEADNKESNKELNNAEKVVDDINNPKGVDTPKPVEVKVLKEQLILNEDLDEEDYFDFVHELYQAMEKVCNKWVNYLDITKDELEAAISEASEKMMDGLGWLVESDEHKSEDSGRLEEDLKLISPLSSYKPWSGAVDTWEKIVDADLVDQLDAVLEDIYPDGLTEDELNDLLWFEPEWVLEALGLSGEELDEE